MEEPRTLYLLVGAALFALGWRGVFANRAALRRIIAVNVMGNGVFLVLIALARGSGEQAADPVPHAMVLTGIVVAVCATALALALEDRLRDTEGEEEGG